MQNGPYIANRLMPKIVAEYCRRSGIGFRSFSSDWVLRLSRDGRTKWVVGCNFDLNGSAAGGVARDKVATYAVLNAAGISAVPHYLVRSLPHELIHDAELHQVLGGSQVVAKPLEGTGGRDVKLFGSADEALAMVRTSGEPAWAFSPLCDLQAEYRLIMLDGELLLTYAKTRPAARGALKLFNLGFGAVAVPVGDGLLPELTAVARRVMQTIALRLAAVDIVRLADGSLHVLEVNGGISMEHYARQSAENKARTAGVYETIVETMFR